jgi:hypothetical protein
MWGADPDIRMCGARRNRASRFKIQVFRPKIWGKKDVIKHVILRNEANLGGSRFLWQVATGQPIMQDFWIIFGTECYENEANFHRFNVQPTLRLSASVAKPAGKVRSGPSIRPNPSESD